MLNAHKPVPPDFAEAYQRRALIAAQFAVQFYKEEQNPFGYPHGLEVDPEVPQLRGEAAL